VTDEKGVRPKDSDVKCIWADKARPGDRSAGNRLRSMKAQARLQEAPHWFTEAEKSTKARIYNL